MHWNILKRKLLFFKINSMKKLKSRISTKILFFILQGCLLVLFAGCIKSDKQSVDKNRIINEGILRITLATSSQQLDPTASDITDELLLRQIFQGLVEKLGDNYTKSALVERMKIDSTKKAIQFQLRTNIQFSDGTSLDSISLSSWITDKKQYGFEISLNRNNLTINYNKIDHFAALELISSHKMLIYRDLKDNIYGTGAFAIENYDAGSFLTLVSNPYYFEADYPKLKKIQVQFSNNYNFSVDNFVALENDLLILDPITTYDLRDNIELGRFNSKSIVDSGRNESVYAIVKIKDSVVSTFLQSKFENLVYKTESPTLQYLSSYDSLYTKSFDSIPIIVADSNWLTNITVEQLLHGEKGLPTDSSTYIHIFSLKNLKKPKNIDEVLLKSNYTPTELSESNLLLLNSMYGKIVYQYYIKNIEYINNTIIDFKKLELQKAELLN